MKLHTQPTPTSCYRTALASVLDLEPGALPAFEREWNRERFIAWRDRWLATRGYRIEAIPATCTLDELLRTTRLQGITGPWLLGCSREGVPHVVVAVGDKIVHDPAGPSDKPLEPLPNVTVSHIPMLNGAFVQELLVEIESGKSPAFELSTYHE